MSEREKFQTAYRAWVKARRDYEVWLRAAMLSKGPSNKTRGLKLARKSKRKHDAFMTAAKPFMRRGRG